MPLMKVAAIDGSPVTSGARYAVPDLRQARAKDWSAVRDLLSDSGLPTEDLGPDRLDGFLIAEEDGRMVGLIGLEIIGTTGLLRSLVVEKSVRKGGVGGKLVGALEAAAEAAGIRDLWLLTIDAERFFGRHGYSVVERTQVPEAIRQTREFGELCPGTAFLMRKPLG